MYALNLLPHLRSISEGLKKFGAHGKLTFETLALEISHEGRYFELVPHFAEYTSDNELKSAPKLTSAVSQFIGWRVGAKQPCEIKTNKLAFKKFCAEHKLRTPEIVNIDGDYDALVLVKEIAPAAFRGVITGPMLLPAARRLEAASSARNFIEGFVDGDPVQAWYWDGKLACVEIHQKATVTGDGITPLRELVDAQCPDYGNFDWQIVEPMALVQGVKLDDVLPSGKEIAVDFRWHTGLKMAAAISENVLDKLTDSPVLEQLTHAGPAFLKAFPATGREHVLFRLDGVIDRQNVVWFTDMDRDNYVHPDVYPTMINSLFSNSARDAVLAKIQASLSSTQH